MNELVVEVGGALLAPHMDIARVRIFLEERLDMEQWEDLAKVPELDVFIDIRPGADLRLKVSLWKPQQHRQIWYRGAQESNVGCRYGGGIVIVIADMAKRFEGLHVMAGRRRGN